MIISLKPGEKVEVHFVTENTSQRKNGSTTFFDQAVVIQHSGNQALVGMVSPSGGFVPNFQVDLAKKS